MKVLNLWGGPGSGKSTTAAGLFFLLKIRGLKVELVTEYAKAMTYEKRENVLRDQAYIAAKQNRSLERLKDQVDFAITDSPLLIAQSYAPDEYPHSFDAFNREIFDSYDNVNVWISRVKPYQQYGRWQTEDEARLKDVELRVLIGGRPFFCVDGDEIAPWRIIEQLEKRKILKSEKNEDCIHELIDKLIEFTDI